MDVDDPYTVEGRPGPRFRVYVWDGKVAGQCVAEYETEQELMKHKQRLDRREVLMFRKKSGTEYVPVMQYIKNLLASKKDKPD